MARKPVRAKLPKPKPLVDITGMVRIDAKGHIFIEDPDLAARLEETYWANNKPDKGERRGVPVSWERPASKDDGSAREALLRAETGRAPATSDSAKVLAWKPPVVNSLCNC